MKEQTNEQEGKISRLKLALKEHTCLKFIFVYPETKPIFKRGYVVNVTDNSFDIEERFDGLMTFGYTYLETIEEEGE